MEAPPPLSTLFIIKLHHMTLYDDNYTAECWRCCHFYCQRSFLGGDLAQCTQYNVLVKLMEQFGETKCCWTDQR